MRRSSFRAWLAIVCGTLFGFAAAPVHAEPRVVVELFTSQGCSSCPAADRLLGELAKNPALLPLSLSVDYWDYLGWKDTLALPGHALRQRAYAGLRGDRAVYTPQAVINGLTHALGSDREAIERAVQRARSGADRASVDVKAQVADGKLTVEVGAAARPGLDGDVWLCPISRQVPVQIGRGENRGTAIVYTNVVRGWIRLGEWSGAAQSFTKPVAEIPADGAVDAVAVLVQARNFNAPGRVYGGTTAPLR